MNFNKRESLEAWLFWNLNMNYFLLRFSVSRMFANVFETYSCRPSLYTFFFRILYIKHYGKSTRKTRFVCDTKIIIDKHITSNYLSFVLSRIFRNKYFFVMPQKHLNLKKNTHFHIERRDQNWDKTLLGNRIRIQFHIYSIYEKLNPSVDDTSIFITLN